MAEAIDFAGIFASLSHHGEREITKATGGVDVRLVRVAAGGEGRWDRHDDSTETVVVWSGSFDVEFRTGAVQLQAGQCCVIAKGEEHRGTSRTGAEIVLFRQSA